MRWLDNVIDSTDMNLSTLQEILNKNKIHWCDHQHSQDIEYFQQQKKFPCAPLQSISPAPLIPSNHCSNFCNVDFCLDLHINGLIQ